MEGGWDERRSGPIRSRHPRFKNTRIFHFIAGWLWLTRQGEWDAKT